jgi:hypothetical protein
MLSNLIPIFQNNKDNVFRLFSLIVFAILALLLTATIYAKYKLSVETISINQHSEIRTLKYLDLCIKNDTKHKKFYCTYSIEAFKNLYQDDNAYNWLINNKYYRGMKIEVLDLIASKKELKNYERNKKASTAALLTFIKNNAFEFLTLIISSIIIVLMPLYILYSANSKNETSNQTTFKRLLQKRRIK